MKNPNEFANKIAFEIKINQAESATNFAAVNLWWISLRIVSGVKYSFERLIINNTNTSLVALVFNGLLADKEEEDKYTATLFKNSKHYFII